MNTFNIKQTYITFCARAFWQTHTHRCFRSWCIEPCGSREGQCLCRWNWIYLHLLRKIVSEWIDLPGDILKDAMGLVTMVTDPNSHRPQHRHGLEWAKRDVIVYKTINHINSYFAKCCGWAITDSVRSLKIMNKCWRFWFLGRCSFALVDLSNGRAVKTYLQ